MKYQVPQFIEVEDKIFGPFTIKQFLYLGGGVGLCFIIWKLIPIPFIAIIVALPVLAFFLALAFYKPNDKPFIHMVEAAFSYATKNKLYVWKKVERKPEASKKVEESTPENAGLFIPKLSDSKLKDLTWSLDVNESMYAGLRNSQGQKLGDQSANIKDKFKI